MYHKALRRLLSLSNNSGTNGGGYFGVKLFLIPWRTLPDFANIGGMLVYPYHTYGDGILHSVSI